MGRPTALVYTEDYMKYDFGPSHPLRPVRVKLFYELLKSYGLIDGINLEEFNPPTVQPNSDAGEALKKAIELVHDREYVEFVKRLDESGGIDHLNEGRFFGIGAGDNPPFPGMYSAASAHVLSTIYSCDLVMSGKASRTFSPGGGFHHAQKRRASGFCIFNDCAVGAKYLAEKYGLKRVMYIDIDAHHGDGVQWLLYEEPRVLKVSIHQDPMTLFPGTGFTDEIGVGMGKGYCANLPVPSGTTDEPYLYGFKETVPLLVKAFKPEVIIAQLGVDTHFSDPLTTIKLTTRAYVEIGKEFGRLLSGMEDVKFVGVSGGGYDVVTTPRCWLILLAGIAGFAVPNDLPESWVRLCKETVDQNPGCTLLDDENRNPDTAQAKMQMEIVKQKVDELKITVFPMHGLKEEKSV
jgi:acetoin utilization protein AcuC